MFGLFKKKDKHDQAIDLIKTYFRHPFFDPSTVEFYREVTAFGRQELSKEDLAILYLCFSIRDAYWVESKVLDTDMERQALGSLMNLGSAIKGIQKAGVKIDSSVLTHFKNLIDEGGFAEQITVTGVQFD